MLYSYAVAVLATLMFCLIAGISIRGAYRPLRLLRLATVYVEAVCFWAADRVREAWERRDRFEEVVRDVEGGRR